MDFDMKERCGAVNQLNRGTTQLAATVYEPCLELSVVIPVYNSAATIAELLDRLTAALEILTDSYEIVLVEDGSPDSSWSSIESVRANYGEHLIAVQLMRNYGQHNALMCGLSLARGRLVITMDDDLQNPPEEISKLVSHIDDGDFDLVYGCPDTRNHSLWRNVGAAIVWQFYRTVFKSRITPTTFRVMRHQLTKSVLFYDLNFTYLDGLLAWCTNRIGTATVAHHTRAQGQSGYSLSKLLLLALNLYTNFSLLPLQIVSLAGFAAALSGFTVGFYYLAQYLASNIEVPGFASTIMAILILGGAQLMALGVIGEYLGRLHLNVNRKPQYVVRQVRSQAEVAEASSTV
jgi:undecaprenyl-phosphate 4-deoxy-4-formamido-L-arabinose transferase